MPPREAEPLGALGAAPVCAETTRQIPKNYVPCVFLGQGGPPKSSKCPAMGWEGAALVEEESSRGGIELNNNSCIDGEFQQWASKRRAANSSKEVGTRRGFQ